jgi:DNA-binding IscR family transcriptional regulator
MLVKLNGVLKILTPRQRKAIQAMVEIGSNPGSDRSAAEMAGLLDLSRESVHQLLAPFVRAGILVAARGRTGGYRTGTVFPETSLADVLTPFAGPAQRPVEEGRRTGLDRIVDALEEEAAGASLAVYQRLTLGELVRGLRAEREALNWEI